MKYTFPMIPATSGPIWLFLIVSIFLFGIMGLLGYFAYCSRHVRLEVSQTGIRITGDIYGRTIPAASVALDGLRVLNLRQDSAYALKRRTNGAGLPGYGAGWFRLANGEKALAFVTDPTHVICIPTRDGYAVLMSVPDPEKVKEKVAEVLTRS